MKQHGAIEKGYRIGFHPCLLLAIQSNMSCSAAIYQATDCVIKTCYSSVQRRFDALLLAGILRLNTTYLVAGLITTYVMA
jgi:hypothetical protein